MFRKAICGMIVAFLGTSAARADVLTVQDTTAAGDNDTLVRDNYLRFDAAENTNGGRAAGDVRMYPDTGFPTGKGPRHLQLWFNVSSIPSGSIVSSVTFGTHWIRNGASAPAITGFNRSLAIRPDNADILTNKGTILDKMNLKDSAIAVYKRAMQLNPNSFFPYINAGLLETNRQHFADAIGYYDQALKVRPDYWDSYLNRAITYYYMKDYNHSLADYNTYLSKVPNSALGWNNLGILKVNLGQKKEGCECLAKAAQLGNKDAVQNMDIYCK